MRHPPRVSKERVLETLRLPLCAPQIYPDLKFHRSEYERLRHKLQQAYEASDLPEAPRGSAALHNLLVRIRLDDDSEE